MSTTTPDTAPAQARAAAAARYRDEIARLRVMTHSPDHTVTATTGPGGVTIGLTLSDLAPALAPDQLAATILATLRAGTAEVARRTVALTEDLLGERSPAVLAMMRTHLPDLDGSTALQASAAGPRGAGWSSLTEEN